MKGFKFISLTYSSSGVKTYVKADAIVQLVEGKGETFVYTMNDSDASMTVKESVDEILTKIEETTSKEEIRKVGKWAVNKDTICCPFCNTKQKIGIAEVELLDTIFTSFKFCKYCGARNEAY